MGPKPILRTFAFVVLLWQSMSLAAAAQSGTGAISGTAQDASKSVLPGVTVTLANPGTIGGNQVVVSDARGAYQFTRLVPGTYSVRGELQGFRTVLHESVVVNADVTARVDLTLEIGDMAETLTVTAQAPLVDTTSALNQVVMDREVIAALPSRNDVWVIGRTVPAIIVNKFDVGGTEGFQQSNLTVHGANQANEGVFAIDGMDVGGGIGAGGSIVMYFPPASFQEINYQIGNAPASSEKGGVVYNMVTRTGTNLFQGGFKIDGANSGMQWENITPRLRNELRAQIPARVLAAYPDTQPEQKIYNMYDSSAQLSGPIVRDRLWFSASTSYNVLNQPRVGSYNADGTAFLDDNKSITWSYKVSWQIEPRHQLHFYQLMVSKRQYHRTGNDTVDFAEMRSTVRQAPNTKYAEQVRWTGVLSSRLLAEVGASLQKGPLISLQQPEVQPGDIPRFDAVTQSHTVAWATYSTRPQHRLVVQPSLSYSAGRHALRFGYEYMLTHERLLAYAMSHYPAGLRAVFRNGVPDSVNTYNTPTNAPSWEYNNAWYVQDRFAAGRKLVVNFGLRFQKTVGRIPALCQAETIFIDARCFDEVDVPTFFDVAPRLSMIYDVFGNGRTALKISANRYTTGLAQTFLSRVHPLKLTNDTRSWTDRNGDLIPQLDELGPSTGFNLGTTNRYNPDLKRPYVNELSAELEHQLPGALVVSIGFYHRQDRRSIGSRNMAVPLESYTPLQVVERSSGQPVTVYNQAAALRGRIDTLWDNFPEANGQYNGVDVNVEKRLTNRWMLRGGVNFGRNTGDVYAGADLNNPNFTFRRGVLDQDVPFAFKLFGLYQMPYGISLSVSGQYSKGFAERDMVSVSRDTVALTQVTQSVQISPAGTNRLPSVTLLDMSVKKQVKVAGLTFAPALNLYNLTNASTVTRRTTLLGPAYGRVVQLLRGRMMKLGLDLDF